MLMPVPLQQRLPHPIPLIHQQRSVINHIIAYQICYLLHVRSIHIQHHGAVEDEAAQFEEGV